MSTKCSISLRDLRVTLVITSSTAVLCHFPAAYAQTPPAASASAPLAAPPAPPTDAAQPPPAPTHPAPLPPPSATGSAPPAPNAPVLPPPPPPPNGGQWPPPNGGQWPPPNAGQWPPPHGGQWPPPAPMMQQPGFPPPWVNRNAPPYTLPYEGGDIPPGYRKVVEWKYGPMIGGGVTFGVMYSFAVVGALNSGKIQYAIPVIGPLFAIEKLPNDELLQLLYGFGYTFVVLDVILQGFGIGYFAYGAATSKAYLVRSNSFGFKPKFTVGPSSIHMRVDF